MRKLLTGVGLALATDDEKSPSDNLFRMLFGRWPETTNDFSTEKYDALDEIIRSATNSIMIRQFFGLPTGQNGKAREKANITYENLQRIENELQMVRCNCALDILLLYGEDTGIDLGDLIQENRDLIAEVRQLQRNADELQRKIDEYKEAQAQQKAFLDYEITVLHLSDNVQDTLWEQNIQNVRELTNRTAFEIRDIANMTDAGFMEIINALSVAGLHLLPHHDNT